MVCWRQPGKAAAAIDGVRGEVDIVLTPRSVPNGHPVAVMPHTVTAARKAELLHRAHRAASTYDPFITQVRTGIMDEEQNILVANSHGLLVEDQRVRTRFTVQAVASKGGEKQTGSSSPGRHMGFELFEQVVDVEKGSPGGSPQCGDDGQRRPVPQWADARGNCQ